MENIKTIKIGFLALLSVLFFLITWWLVNLSIFSGKSLIFWLMVTAVMAFSVALLTLFSLANSNRIWFLSLNSLICAAYLLIFPKDFYVLVGGIVFFALGFWFERRIKEEENSRADFSLRRVMSLSINMIIYGLLLMLAFNIYHNTSSDFKRNPDAFYDQLGKSAAAGAEKIDLNQTLDQFLTKQGVSSEQEKQEVRREVLRQLGINNQNDEPLSLIISRSFTARIKQAAQPYQQFFPLIFTLVVLALLRTFAFLFRWFTLLLTWILFRFLLKFKFFKIEKVPVEVNKLII